MVEYIERGGKNFPTPFSERPNMPLEKGSYRQGWNHCLRAVLQQPAADVVPVKHGRWRDTGSGQECSICKEIQYGYDTGRYYCPNCGADMRHNI